MGWPAIARRARSVRPRANLVEAIERLRLDFPMCGRAKLGPLVREQGFAVSDATLGRIIAQLVARRAVQPVLTLRRRPYARRSGPRNAASPSVCRAT